MNQIQAIFSFNFWLFYSNYTEEDSSATYGYGRFSVFFFFFFFKNLIYISLMDQNILNEDVYNVLIIIIESFDFIYNFNFNSIKC